MALAGHPREEGAGVAVTRYWKAGSVDYKKVIELRGVDLEVYRGKGREEVRVSIASWSPGGKRSEQQLSSASPLRPFRRLHGGYMIRHIFSKSADTIEHSLVWSVGRVGIEPTTKGL